MRKLMILLVVLAASVSAHAGPVVVALYGFNGGLWQWGYPYNGFVQGTGPTDLMCDDYMHGGEPGQTWLANQTNLGSQSLGSLRFNNLPDALTLYDEAGWLLIETLSNPQPAWRDMNGAVWHIFDPSAPLTPAAYWWLMQAQNEAANGFQGVDFSRVEILTPLDQYSPDPNSPQEMMYLTQGATPEPGTLLLLGTGLAALLSRKRIV